MSKRHDKDDDRSISFVFDKPHFKLFRLRYLPVVLVSLGLWALIFAAISSLLH